MTEHPRSGGSPTGQKVLRALRDEPLCERDLFIRLRPVDRLALHRLLPEMVQDGHIFRYSKGSLPGPVVEMFSLPRVESTGLDPKEEEDG